MITYITLFLAKFIDSFLQGSKSIAVHKRQPFKAGILNCILTSLFLFIISKVIATNDNWSILVVSLAAGFGMSYSILFDKRKEKDAIWQYEIQCENIIKARKLADDIKTQRIEVTTRKGYLGEKNKALFVNCISHTRDESKLIEDLAPNESEIKVTKIIKKSK